MPVAGGDLGEQRKERIAQVADSRRLLPRDAAGEPVAFAVVGLAVGDGLEDLGQLLGVHLAVAGHDRHDLHLRLQRRLVAGGDGLAYTATGFVADELDAVASVPGPVLDDLGGLVGAAVVDHEDAVDELGHGGQHAFDLPLLVVSRDHDPNPAALEHGRAILKVGTGDRTE